MPEPIKVDVVAQDTAQIVPAPVAPAPVAAPPAVVNADPNYDPNRIVATGHYIGSNPQAEIDLINDLARRPGTAIHTLIIERAQDKAARQYNLADADLPLIAANTPEEVIVKAQALRARYDQIAGVQNQAPPVINLPEPQYTPQEAQRIRMEYDIKNDPEAQRLLRQVRGY
jgi:hypothetical protein